MTARTEADRAEAHRRWLILRAHLEDGVALSQVAAETGVRHRTLQRWLARYRSTGLAGLARTPRADQGRSRFPEPLRLLIEGLALRKPAASAAHVHRQVTEVAEREGWAVPSYGTVYAIARTLDPAMVTLAQEGQPAFRGPVRAGLGRAPRQPAQRPLAGRPHRARPVPGLPFWEANGTATRPWLTTVIWDDHSLRDRRIHRTSASPSALHTSLALRQAIWRKTDPAWPVCGIPDVLYVDHGSDFTSTHLGQVAADLRIELVYSAVGVDPP